MYTQTLAKTIAEATEKLFALRRHDFVVDIAFTALTDTQTDALAKHMEIWGYADEDINLAINHIFVSLVNRHLYVLEMSDGENDELHYYFSDIAVPIHLYVDAHGMLEHI